MRAGQAAAGASGTDEDRALDALMLAWGGEYDEIWVHDGEWAAHRKDAADGAAVTGATPEELDRAIREREGAR
jgi:hypothetical protein